MSFERTLAYLSAQNPKKTTPTPVTSSSSTQPRSKSLRRNSKTSSSVQPQPSSSSQTHPQSEKKSDQTETNLLETEDSLETSEANQWNDFLARIRAIQNNKVSLLQLNTKIKKDIFEKNIFSISARLIDLCNHYVNHAHPIIGKHDDNAKFLKKLISFLANENTGDYCDSEFHRAFYNYILIQAFTHHLSAQKSKEFIKLFNDFLLSSTFEDGQQNPIYLFPEEKSLPSDIKTLVTQLSELFTKKNDEERSQFWKNFIKNPTLNNIFTTIFQSKQMSINDASKKRSENVIPEKSTGNPKSSDNSPPTEKAVSDYFDISGTIAEHDPGIAGTSEKKQESEKSDTLSNATGSNTTMASNVIPNDISGDFSDEVPAGRSNSISTPTSNPTSVVAFSVINQNLISAAPEQSPDQVNSIFSRKNTQ